MKASGVRPLWVEKNVLRQRELRGRLTGRFGSLFIEGRKLGVLSQKSGKRNRREAAKGEVSDCLKRKWSGGRRDFFTTDSAANVPLGGSCAYLNANCRKL